MRCLRFAYSLQYCSFIMPVPAKNIPQNTKLNHAATKMGYKVQF